MNKILLSIICTLFIINETYSQTAEVPEGAVKGLFSVSKNRKVYFAKGNLQFCNSEGTHKTADNKTKKGTWRFAEHQYDVIDSSKIKISKNLTSYYDIFSWATSGYNNSIKDKEAVNFEPWATKNYEELKNKKPNEVIIIIGRYMGFGPSNRDTINYINGNKIYKWSAPNDKYYDWGVYNAISNGGNKPNIWRTPTINEFNYILYSRPNADKLLAHAEVNGVCGLILLPDDWETPQGITLEKSIKNKKVNIRPFYYDPVLDKDFYYTAINHIDPYINKYTIEQWDIMESAGAVFLPLPHNPYDNIEITGKYWTSSSTCNSSAYSLTICHFVELSSSSDRVYKHYVRLVTDAE